MNLLIMLSWSLEMDLSILRIFYPSPITFPFKYLIAITALDLLSPASLTLTPSILSSLTLPLSPPM
jgi:hypothetical protein